MSRAEERTKIYNFFTSDFLASDGFIDINWKCNGKE